MTGQRNGFGVVDLLIVGVVGGALLLAAIYSESIVARGDNGADLTAPPIGWRDQFFGVATPAPEIVWMAGGGGKVVRSDDGGTNWVIQTTGVTENLQDIDAWDEDRAVAVGNDGLVIITGDGGTSWRPVDAPRSEVANKLIRIRADSSGSAWAVGVMGMILYSADWGATWERRTEEIDVAWNDIEFADEANGWVVGEFGSMMHTSDGGQTWETVEPVVERSLMGLAFRDADSGVAVGLDGLILTTDDAGVTWSEVESGTPLHLFDVVWTGEEWVAVGAMGMVVTNSGDGGGWRARRLSDRDLAWHTEVVPMAGGVFIVGASQGLWRGDQWTPVGLG